MRVSPLIVAAAAAVILMSSWPADAQTRRGARLEREPYPGARTTTVRTGRAGQRARITVRRARSYLDPGTEVLPRSQSSLDYAFPPGWYATRIWDTTGAFRSPLAQPFELPNF